MHRRAVGDLGQRAVGQVLAGLGDDARLCWVVSAPAVQVRWANASAVNLVRPDTSTLFSKLAAAGAQSDTVAGDRLSGGGILRSPCAGAL